MANASDLAIRRARGLTADETAARLRRATAQLVARGSYAEVRVEDVARAAGVTRATFYARYANKEACVLAAAAEAGRVLVDGARAAASAAAGGPDDRLAALIEASFGLIARDPATARFVLFDSQAVGAAGRDLRERLRTDYARLICEQIAPGVRSARVSLVGRTTAGAIERIILSRLHAGRERHLPELAPSVAAWAMSYLYLLEERRDGWAAADGRGREPLRSGSAPGTLVPASADTRKLAPGPQRRDRVAAHQHARILDAVARVVARSGYPSLTTRDRARGRDLAANPV